MRPIDNRGYVVVIRATAVEQMRLGGPAAQPGFTAIGRLDKGNDGRDIGRESISKNERRRFHESMIVPPLLFGHAMTVIWRRCWRRLAHNARGQNPDRRYPPPLIPTTLPKTGVLNAIGAGPFIRDFSHCLSPAPVDYRRG